MCRAEKKPASEYPNLPKTWLNWVVTGETLLSPFKGCPLAGGQNRVADFQGKNRPARGLTSTGGCHRPKGNTTVPAALSGHGPPEISSDLPRPSARRSLAETDDTLWPSE